MAIQQYIGARYVPKFMGTFDSTIEYEPLSVVDDGNGNSYTSKIQVPAGTDLSNRRYWAPTGNYSAAVNQLQTRMTAAEGNIINLQDTINGLQDDVDLLTDKDIDLQSQIDKLTDKDIDLQSQIDKLTTGRKFIVLGDSFGYGISPNVTHSDGKGWIDYAVETFGPDVIYHPIMPEPLPVIGFSSNNSFKWCLQNAVTVPDKSTITDIVVMGGTNDIHNLNGVIAGIEDFCNYASANYPNAKIRIGIVGSNLDFLKMQIAPLYQKCANYGAEYFGDGLNLFSIPEYISSDGVHLTQDGYSYYKEWTNNLILSGRANYRHEFTIPLTVNTAELNPLTSQSNAPQMSVIIEQDKCLFQITTASYNNASYALKDRNIPKQGNTTKEMFTFTDNLRMPNPFPSYPGNEVFVRGQPTPYAEHSRSYRAYIDINNKRIMFVLCDAIGNPYVGDTQYTEYFNIIATDQGIV